MSKTYTIDNHEHTYFAPPDGWNECNLCGLKQSTIEGRDKTSVSKTLLERWEKDAVGKNVHSVFVYCFECKTDGINLPLERECGNCKSLDTTTYYDRETISIILTQKLEEQAKKYKACVPEKREINMFDELETIAIDEEWNNCVDTIRKNMEETKT